MHHPSIKGNTYPTNYYLRDAQGNVLAIYETINPANTTNTDNIALKEVPIYGSTRLGQYRPFKDDLEQVDLNKKTALGQRIYEFSNHLGNVLVTLADFKVPNQDGSYKSIVISASDYYPFGMAMTERTYQNEDYRYGFNGQEQSDELDENGNSYTAEFWQYDSRIGRRWNIDPVVSVEESGYAALRNSPLLYIDAKGDHPVIVFIVIAGIYWLSPTPALAPTQDIELNRKALKEASKLQGEFIITGTMAGGATSVLRFVLREGIKQGSKTLFLELVGDEGLGDKERFKAAAVELSGQITALRAQGLGLENIDGADVINAYATGTGNNPMNAFIGAAVSYFPAKDDGSNFQLYSPYQWASDGENIGNAEFMTNFAVTTTSGALSGKMNQLRAKAVLDGTQKTISGFMITDMTTLNNTNGTGNTVNIETSLYAWEYLTSYEYRVQSGDNLWSISQESGFSVEDLLYFNPHLGYTIDSQGNVNAKTFTPGMIINIPFIDFEGVDINPETE